MSTLEFAVRHDAGQFYVEVHEDRELKKLAGPVGTIAEAETIIAQYREMAQQMSCRPLPLATQ